MIEEIIFSNYKIFKEKQSLKLKPITVLLGKNNSGKSAIAKLPLMVGHFINEGTLNWKVRIGTIGENFVELGSGFKDLIYNRIEIGTLNLKIVSGEKENNCAFYLKNGVIEQRFGEEADFMELGTIILPFEIDELETYKFRYDYIGAIRVSPEGDYQNSTDKFDKIGNKGQNAYPILIQDYENDQNILSKVSSWYEKNFEGWTIKVNKIDTSEIKYEIVLENGLSSINIKQTGQGIHQVLPLIVRSYLPEIEQTLIVVEEPETHLHPAAHGDLAQRFVDSVLEDENKKYLIETHSQNFVLRIRRLIAEGIFSKDDFALYFTQYDQNTRSSSLKQIEIDSKGNILHDDWPKGIFSEASVEVRGILNAQMEY